jgi:hypothetical protein
LQAALSLSNPPSPPEASPVAQAETVPLSKLAQDVQTMRTLVQSQQSQLKTLQALEQSQPLVGFTTDVPWGMALEGLVLGGAALALGAASLLGSRAVRWGRPDRPRSVPVVPAAAPAEFSDSMLYLADQADAQESLPPVTTHLHDPQQDAKASTLAHEDGDSELEYHRMALTAQGLSVTAGAGHVDSDRVPLETRGPSAAGDKEVDSVFSPPLSRAEFDQRAAAEEVERVRRYLAQRRADRARGGLSAMGTAAVPAPASPPPIATTEPVQGVSPELDIDLDTFAPLAAPRLEPVVSKADVCWEDLVPAAPAPLALPDQAAAPAMGVSVDPDLDVLAHVELSKGASLLAALGEAESAPLADEALLAWDASASPPSATVEADALLPGLVPMPVGHVQLALAQEFRDLGLWEEAKARVLEILNNPMRSACESKGLDGGAGASDSGPAG